MCTLSTHYTHTARTGMSACAPCRAHCVPGRTRCAPCRAQWACAGRDLPRQQLGRDLHFPVTTHSLQLLCRDLVFQVATQTFNLAPFSVATSRPNACRTLSRQETLVATWVAQSQPKPCRDNKPAQPLALPLSRHQFQVATQESQTHVKTHNSVSRPNNQDPMSRERTALSCVRPALSCARLPGSAPGHACQLRA